MIRSRRGNKHPGRRMTRRVISDLRRPETKVWQMASQPLPAQILNAARDNQVYTVRQTVEFGPLLTSSAGAETNVVTSFVLSQLTGVASWTAVFDQYRIDEIEMWLTPTTNTTGNAAGFDQYRLYNVIDYDDDASTTISALVQYQNVCDVGRFEGVYRKWRPHIQGSLNNASNALVGSQNIASTWIDCAQPSIKHYGVKSAQTATSTTVVLSMRARFKVSFRNVF